MQTKQRLVLMKKYYTRSRKNELFGESKAEYILLRMNETDKDEDEDDPPESPNDPNDDDKDGLDLPDPPGRDDF